MTWEELNRYVRNRRRTAADLQPICRVLGLPTEGNRDELRERLEEHIAQQPQDEKSPWPPSLRRRLRVQWDQVRPWAGRAGWAILILLVLGALGTAIWSGIIASQAQSLPRGRAVQTIVNELKLEAREELDKLDQRLAQLQTDLETLKSQVAQAVKDVQEIPMLRAEVQRLKKQAEQLTKTQESSTEALEKRIAQLEATKQEEDKAANLEIPNGFTPDKDLIDITDEVDLAKVPADLKPYRQFPDVKGVWGKPRAGYNFGYNDACRDVSRRCNIQIPTWKWVVVTGEEINLPGIGSIKDPDGGAALAVIINVWEVPGEFEKAYILRGFWGVGEVWDMSDMTIDKEGNPSYGAYTLETMATLRNHYLNQLGSEEPNPEFRGQCGSGSQCKSITWVAVLRWYDGSFRLVGKDQWVR